MTKKIFAIALVLVLIATLIPGVALADKPDKKGNGLPRDAGKSFNFNVIGVPEDSHWGWDDDSGGNGKRIFITREGQTKFYIWGGDSFAIQDRNGIDGEVGWGRGSDDPALAGIILPYDTSEGKWDCTIYVRLLGPANRVTDFRWKSEYWDGSYWQPISTFVLGRNTKFNVPTGQVLADGYRDILWTWDEKHNYKICQFRIFVGAPEGGYPPPAS